MRKILSIGLSILSAFTMIISTSSCAVKDWTNQLFCEHEFGQEVITRESTCSKEGEVTKTCKLCGYKDKQAIDKTPHIELYVESKEATCIEKGHTDYVKCKVCDEVIVAAVDIPMTGHKIVTDKGVKATCLTSGITDGEHCETCGKVFTKQTNIVATGHSLVVVEGRASTCTTAGLTAGVKCEYCNEIFTEQEELPLLEHNYVDGECSVCGLVEYVGDDSSLYSLEQLNVGDSVESGVWYRIDISNVSSSFGNFVIMNSLSLTSVNGSIVDFYCLGFTFSVLEGSLKCYSGEKRNYGICKNVDEPFVVMKMPDTKCPMMDDSIPKKCSE